MTNIQQSLEMETNLSLLHNKSGNGLINNLKALKNTVIDLKLPHDGDTILLPRRIRWQATSDWKSTWSWDSWQTSPWTEQYFFFNCSEISIRLPEICNLLAIDGVCRQTHLPRTTFSHAQMLHRLVFTCCQSVQSHIDPMHLHGSSREARCLRFAQHLILIEQCRAPCRT